VKTQYSRILVTGGSGVLGTALKVLATSIKDREFIFFTSEECDLTNFQNTVNFVKLVSPDAILHLAALSGGVELSTNFPATLLRDNILMTFNILEAARLTNCAKTLLTLSSGMYPPEAPLPINERTIHSGPPHFSNYSYSHAKRIMEPAIRAYRTEYEMNVIGLVPNGIFGEGDDFRHQSSTMLPALIRRFFENKNSAELISVWGDGTPLREYTYSIDMAQCFLWCLDNYHESSILNVGTNEEHTIKGISFMIADFLNIDRSRILFDPTKPRGVYQKSMDNSTFCELSNFQYSTLAEGLRKTIDWFQDNYPNKVRL